MHFQSHSLLTRDIQYAVQMKTFTVESERVGGSALVFDSRCIMHLTVSQTALLCASGLTFTLGTNVVYIYVTVKFKK